MNEDAIKQWIRESGELDPKKAVITQVTKKFSSMRCDIQKCFRKIRPGVHAFQIDYEFKGKKISQIICQQCYKFIPMDAAHEKEQAKNKKAE